MAPVVDGLVGEYNGKVEIKRMNVEKDKTASDLASSFKVQYVPTFVFLNADGTTSNMIVGEATKSKLKDQLDALK